MRINKKDQVQLTTRTPRRRRDKKNFGTKNERLQTRTERRGDVHQRRRRAAAACSCARRRAFARSVGRRRAAGAGAGAGAGAATVTGAGAGAWSGEGVCVFFWRQGGRARRAPPRAP